MERIVIDVKRGCLNLVSSIPHGIELIIKDYDVIEDKASPTQKSDYDGIYEEAVYTDADNKVGRKK